MHFADVVCSDIHTKTFLLQPDTGAQLMLRDVGQYITHFHGAPGIETRVKRILEFSFVGPGVFETERDSNTADAPAITRAKLEARNCDLAAVELIANFAAATCGIGDSADKIVEARYHYPFVAHANMEPQNCTALMHESGKLELWAPTQNGKGGRQQISRTLGIPEDRIHVNQLRMGTAFGRRSRRDFMTEAAWIARETGKPVQLVWTREEDMRHDFYRPPAWHHFKAGLDKAGKMIAFDHHFITLGMDGKPVSGANLSAKHYPAGLVPNFRLRRSMITCHIPTGPQVRRRRRS